jgi:hypothetical protein
MTREVSYNGALDRLPGQATRHMRQTPCTPWRGRDIMMAVVVSSVCGARARGELTAKVADFSLSWGPWCLSCQAALPQ